MVEGIRLKTVGSSELVGSELTPFITIQVMDMFQPKRIFLLTSRKSHEYLSAHLWESDDAGGSPHTLRALRSGSWGAEPLARSLEPPNTLIGEAAAG